MSDVDSVQAWRAVLRAQDAVVRAVEEDLAAAGAIDLSWYDVLLELDPTEGLRIQDLAARTVLSRSRVSRLVDELVRGGLVERVPDPSDGRATLVTTTAAGRRALRKAAPIYMAGIERHFGRLLSEREKATIAGALDRVIEEHQPTIRWRARR